MTYSIIFLMDVSLTGNERGRSTITRFKNLATFLARNEMNIYWISCRGKKDILKRNKSDSINDYIFHSKFRSILPIINIFVILFVFLKHLNLKILSYFPSIREGLPALIINLISFGKISYYVDYMDLSPRSLSPKSERRFLGVLLERLILSRAKKVSVISPFLYSWVESLGVSDNAIEMIPLCISDVKRINPINPRIPLSLEKKLSQIKIPEDIKQWIQQIKRNRNNFLIGYQGSFHPNQGLKMLISAFSDEKIKFFYLILAGGTNSKSIYGKNIKDLVTKVNSTYSIDKIKITGYLQSKDIQSTISLFDYGIAPKPLSIINQATFPSKCLRYLLERIPIIVTPTGWLKELALNTGGILIEEYNIDSIIKAINSIQGKHEIDNSSWKYIHKRFSTTRNLLKWVFFLEL